MKYFYEITEENVDGCGTNASETVSCQLPLTEKELQTLKECLDESKQEAVSENMTADTHDMISDALDKFREKIGKTLQFDCAIKGYLTF